MLALSFSITNIVSTAAHARTHETQAEITSNDLAQAVSARGLMAKKRASASKKSEYVDIIIEFASPSMATMAADYKATHGVMPSKQLQLDYAKTLKQQQQSVLSQLSTFDIKHIRNFTTSLSGAKCRVNKDDIAIIEKIVGVKGVRTINTYMPKQNIDVGGARSNMIQPYAFLGGKTLLDAGYTGKGVTIAVVDQGVNYLLQGLGGHIPANSLNGTDFSTQGNNPNIIEEGSFPNSKVIGGIDLAGARYNPFSDDEAIRSPSPDPDPLEPLAVHGTVSAALSAANTGFDFDPGFAPDAKILAIKVFGDAPTGTNLVVDAIEYALDPNQDGLIDDAADIINLSLGSNFGTENNADVIAIENATKLGVLVVAAAGNTANQPFTVGSPSTAPSAISVAASTTQSLDKVLNFTINSPTLHRRFPTYELTFTGGEPSPTASINTIDAPLVLPKGFETCQPLTDDYSGKVILLRQECIASITTGERREPAFSPRSRDGSRYIASVRAAQPEGVIIVISSNQPVSRTLFIPNSFRLISSSSSEGAAIENTFTVGQYHGDMIVKALERHGEVQLTLNSTQVFADSSFTNVPSYTSSRGPSATTNNLKPEISAPGDGIQVLGSSSTLGGSSFSTPIVSGIAAALMEKFPEMTPQAIKALVLNSAQPMQVVSEANAPLAPLPLQGLGQVRADIAAQLSSITSPAVLSLGLIEVEKPTYIRRELTLTNTSDTFKTYSITAEPNRTVQGIEYRTQETVNVPANSTRTVHVGILLRPGEITLMDKNGFPIDGWLRIQSGNEVSRVGYFGVVKPSSNIGVRKSGNQTVLLNRSKIVGEATAYHHAPDVVEFFSDNLDETALPKIGYRTLRNDKGAFLDVVFINPTSHVLPFRSSLGIAYLIDIFNNEASFSASFTSGDLGILNQTGFSNTPFVRNEDPRNRMIVSINAPNNANWYSVRFPIDEQLLSVNSTIAFSGFTQDFSTEFFSEDAHFMTSSPTASGPVTNPGIRKVDTPISSDGFWFYPQNINSKQVEEIQ